MVGQVYETYEKIQNNIPTIFAPNCWGDKLCLNFC